MTARRVLITGAASGLGRETAFALARRGDHVIVADRNVAGGAAVVRAIGGAGGSAELRELDLADLARVREFAADEVARGLPLDVAINNAGLLPPAVRATTRDGFEMVFGVAYLGHFALTNALLPALLRSPRPRVVSIASIAHVQSRIVLDDLAFERDYNAATAYARAKLACLMFAIELDRRARAAGSRLVSVAAHPGIVATPIAAGWQHEERRKLRDRLDLVGYRLSMLLFARSAAEGAKSLVHAASEPDVVGGGYYGPTGFLQIRGRTGPVVPHRQAMDAAVAAALWEQSERLTGARFIPVRDSPPS